MVEAHARRRHVGEPVGVSRRRSDDLLRAGAAAVEDPEAVAVADQGSDAPMFVKPFGEVQ